MTCRINLLSTTELQGALLDGGEIALLDVREAGQFGEGHLLFAVPLPYSRLEIDAARLVPRKGTRLVLCDDGALGIARQAANRLSAAGYTDISLLRDGTAAWEAEGYMLFKGVNVPSKLFGEMVKHVYQTPMITPRELMDLRKEGKDMVVLDGRTPAEHQNFTIPGSICCPNAELPYRIHDLVRSATTKIIVNCAGRTRSIIGAQTLRNFGVPNPVYALKNGTQGWILAGFELERGSTRRYPERGEATIATALQRRYLETLEGQEIGRVGAEEVSSWLADETRTTYLFDVRTAEEFSAGTLPGARHVPGGQLIQTTDQWVGVRNARIILFDGGDGVRATMTASWLQQMGHMVFVLEDGLHAEMTAADAVAPSLPVLPEIDAQELNDRMAEGSCTVFDLSPSMSYRQCHIPGSLWSTRSRLGQEAKRIWTPVVLTGADSDIARLASSELSERGFRDIVLFRGGIAAWTASVFETAASADVPPERECIDHLFFVDDRHMGNKAAMVEYLSWETGLMKLASPQELAMFRLPQNIAPGRDRHLYPG